MKYLYTTKPDDHCHEVEPGIYGRPAQTSEQSKLRKLGWVYHISDLKGDDHVREEKEGRQEEVEVSETTLVLDDASDEELADLYERVFGKKPHHKMKRETMRKKLSSGSIK